MFYILPSSVDSQHVLAFVKGGDMPNPDEVAPLASSLLQVESKPMTYVLYNGCCIRVLTSLPRPSAALTTRKRRLCEICTTDPSYPVMLDEVREWERHCKSARHLYLANLKVRGEQEAAFQEAQIDPFPVRTLVEVQTFSTRTAWNAARRMRAAHQFACI